MESSTHFSSLAGIAARVYKTGRARLSEGPMEDLCGSKAAKRALSDALYARTYNVVIETVVKPLRLDDLPLEIKIAIVQKSGNLFVIRGASRGWKEELTKAKLEFEANKNLAGYVGSQPEQHRRVTQSFEHLNNLGRICTLTSLALSGCHVARAPGNRFTTAASSKLERFSLERVVTEVRLIIDVFNFSRYLKVVELIDCRLSDREFGLLGDALHLLANLTTLTVGSAGMTEGAGMTRFANGLATRSQLEMVDFSGNDFTSGLVLGEALAKLGKLTHFNCRQCKLNAVGFEQILYGLKNCSQLQWLTVKSLDAVTLDPNGAMREAIESISKLSNLQQLQLYGFPIGAHALDINVELLTRLYTLELSGCNINRDTFKGILSTLVRSSCLVTLDCERNGGIDDDALNAIIDFAKKVPTLKFVFVNGTRTSIGELRAVSLQLRLLSNAILVFDDEEDSESEEEADDLNVLDVFGDSGSDSEPEDPEPEDSEPEDPEPEDSDSEEDESD